jgi:hypothetical protein
MLDRLFAAAKRHAGFSDLPEAPIPETFRRPRPLQTLLF